MLSLLTRSSITRGRRVAGGFLAVALGATLAASGFSAAGASAATSVAVCAAASLPVNSHARVVRPHGGVVPAAGSNLTYHGGPVENEPRLYVVYWGWTSDPSGEKPYLNSFLSSVGGSSWLSIVAQYGGGYTGQLLKGTWADSTSVPKSPTDAQVQAEAKKAATHFSTGTSCNVQIIVATPTGHSESGFGTQFCAYHGDISADPDVTYTYLPYMTDAGAACGENAVNGGSGGLLDGVSIVEGHELAEVITDPLFNAWYDVNGMEISDTCAWTDLGDVILSGKSFAMQPLWSNSAGGCVLG